MAFENLEKLALAMGHQSLGIRALEELAGHGVGAFSRLAVQHGVPVDVGVAAKREFVTLMVQGAEMFRPANTVANAAKRAQEAKEAETRG